MQTDGLGATGHEMHAAGDTVSAVTRTQLAAVTVLTLLALVGSYIFAASRANLSLSAHDVGGLIMPPGMIMGHETTGESMRDMAAVDLRTIAYAAPADARGDQLLQARLEGGVKVFRLEAEPVRWHILPGVRVAAYAFNRQVPGPRMRVTEGDRVRIEVTNRLPEATSVHWHGLILPNAMDGASEITQAPIPPGSSYSYEFVAQQAGTFFYHSHHHVDRQQTLGLYGALIVDPRDPARTPAHDKELVVQLQEWTHNERWDMVWEAREPGKWLIHCHINHHTTNDNTEQHGGGGLILVIDVS